MKKVTFLLSNLLLMLAVASIVLSGSQPVSAQGRASDQAAKQARTKWFFDARFGMMITWGAYSQTGGYWKGVYSDNYAEWLKYDMKIPDAEYDSLVRAFNPVNFNAGEWVEIARSAGMKYIILMAKHHDGFALYNSAISDYDIMDMTRFGRDPVGELALACRKADIKFGVYYSVDRDWHHPDAACDDKYKQCNYWDYPQNRTGGMDRWHNRYFPNYAVKQVTELVTNYPVDLFWFDGIGIKTREEVALLDSIIHAIRPYCLINSRISNFVGSSDGDYGSKGDNETPNGYQAGGWENPGTLGFSYAYSVHDTLMSPKKAIHNLIEMVSKGGNYLLNVGPDGRGTIRPDAVHVLKEMGSWLKRYGSGIYGADGLPVKPPEDVLLTVKPHQLFVHVLSWDGKELRIPGITRITGKSIDSVKKVYMLADADKRNMDFQVVSDTLIVNLSSGRIPPEEINTHAEVIVVSDGRE